MNGITKSVIKYLTSYLQTSIVNISAPDVVSHVINIQFLIVSMESPVYMHAQCFGIPWCASCKRVSVLWGPHFTRGPYIPSVLGTQGVPISLRGMQNSSDMGLGGAQKRGIPISLLHRHRYPRFSAWSTGNSIILSARRLVRLAGGGGGWVSATVGDEGLVL